MESDLKIVEEVEQKLKVDEKSEEEKKSALHESIKQYGQHSYYYAHKPKDFDLGKGKRFEGSGIIYGGEPVLLEKKESSKEAEVKTTTTKTITKYSWLDEKKKVKIYIDLTQELFKDKNITENMIDLKVEDTSMTLSVVDEESNCYEFKVKKLNDKVEPEKCTVMISSGKIKISLHKWIETKWRELAAKK